MLGCWHVSVRWDQDWFGTGCASSLVSLHPGVKVTESHGLNSSTPGSPQVLVVTCASFLAYMCFLPSTLLRGSVALWLRVLCYVLRARCSVLRVLWLHGLTLLHGYGSSLVATQTSWQASRHLPGRVVSWWFGDLSSTEAS